MQEIFSDNRNCRPSDSQKWFGMSSGRDLQSALRAEIRAGLDRPGKSKSGLAAVLGITPSGVTAMLGEGRNGKPRLIKAHEVPLIRDYFASEQVDDRADDNSAPSEDGIREVIR